MINKNQVEMMKRLNGNVNSYDFADEGPNAGAGVRLDNSPNNPPSIAQFEISILVKYFTVAGGVYTSIAAAALVAALKTQVPAFIFGQADFASGFKRAQGQFPLAGGWAYDYPFVYGSTTFPATVFGVLDATAKAQLQYGDLVIPVWATTAGPVNTVALVIIRCNSVAYGTLLDALSSDRFWINNVRYTLTDTSAGGLTQYNNALFLQRQSLFGKYKQDSVSANTNKSPQQYQAGIVDLPINEGFDKNGLVGTYINYDSISQSLSMFIKQVDKINA